MWIGLAVLETVYIADIDGLRVNIEVPSYLETVQRGQMDGIG